MTIMRLNGKNIYIPKDATAELAALKQKQKDSCNCSYLAFVLVIVQLTLKGDTLIS